jgi:hypothetical protein
MKNFLIKMFVFVILTGLISILLVSTLFELKQKRIDQIKGQPKIVLFGGSSCRHGFNSEMLEQSLHRKSVNLAITNHQGLFYYMEWSKTFLDKGDVVVISPEYDITNKGGFYGSHKLCNVSAADKNFLKFLAKNKEAIKQLVSHLK